jgi:hypothetical protein
MISSLPSETALFPQPVQAAHKCIQKEPGFTSCGKTQALYQGTTLVGP